jgi:tetratricopeptide (TPR) repeat protein
MRLASRVATALAAAFAANVAAGAEPTQSTTVMGPSNAQLADGATALEQGRVEDGIRLTLEGLRSPNGRQDQAAGYSNLCAGYAMLQKWDEALQHCNAAIELDNNNWRSFNNRAAVYTGKGQYDKAVDDIRAGLRLAPNSRTLNESLRIIEENRRLLASRSRTSVRPP